MFPSASPTKPSLKSSYLAVRKAHKRLDRWSWFAIPNDKGTFVLGYPVCTSGSLSCLVACEGKVVRHHVNYLRRTNVQHQSPDPPALPSAFSFALTYREALGCGVCAFTKPHGCCFVELSGGSGYASGYATPCRLCSTCNAVAGVKSACAAVVPGRRLTGDNLVCTRICAQRSIRGPADV